MSPFAAYEGLFAEHAAFDVPANYTLGIAINPNGPLTFAADYGRINYADVASIGNSSQNRAPLGESGGPGFGWQSISIERIGLEWHAFNSTTLRIGFNHGENPIRARDVTFNILALRIETDHLT